VAMLKKEVLYLGTSLPRAKLVKNLESRVAKRSAYKEKREGRSAETAVRTADATGRSVPKDSLMTLVNNLRS